MNNSVLIKVISAFRKSEIREFSRFVNSPFFNGRKETALFWGVVKKFYPDFSAKNFTAEYIFQKIYPERKFDIAEIRRLSSYTLKLAEQYLAYRGLESDPFYFDLSLSIQYALRGLFSRSQKQLEVTDTKYSANKGDYEFYFWKRYLIERQKNSLYSYTGDDHLASESIIKRTDMFSYHTAAVMCRSLISLFINEKNFNTDYTNSFFYLMVKNLDLDKFINSLAENKSEFYPVLAAEYYQAMALIKPGSEDFYLKFKEVINGNLEMFTHLERINFYSIFEAVCTLKIENGEEGFAGDLFEAYKRMLAEGLYSYQPGGEFILRIFRNIVHMAVLLKQFDWLELFINDHTHKLPADSRRNMQNLADALLYFERGQFGLSLDKLNRIDYELFHFKIDIKNLQLKLYFELGYHEELLSAADTYRHFIVNNKYISHRYRMLCSGFVNFLIKVNKLKTDEYSAENSEFIRNEIESSKGYLYKEWLLEKVIEVKK
jgi:hypothetical protein